MSSGPSRSAVEHRAPIFGRGGGTSLAGQCCNVAVVFDFSKYMNRVLEIDPSQRLARVQPGTILDDLRHAAQQHGLTFGPDPSTHNHCTLGGMIGNNSCGVHSVMAQFAGTGPRTSDQVEWLDILHYDGTRMRVGETSDERCAAIVDAGGREGAIYAALRELRDRHARDLRDGMPHLPRRVSGYNLDALLPEHDFNVAHALVGSEGTCVLVLEAMVRLIPNPKARTLVVLGYPSVYEAADHVPQIMAHRPIGCEGMDDKLVQDIESIGYESDVLQILPEGHGFLLVEFGGDSKQDADATARRMLNALETAPGAPTSKALRRSRGRAQSVESSRSGPGRHRARRPRPSHMGGLGRFGGAAREARHLSPRLSEAARRVRLHGDLYGHFGQGCLHTRIDFDLETADGIRRYRAFVEEAADLVVSLGGSLSGEHGDGQSRGELLSKMFGPGRDGRLPRVQGDLGSRVEDEPGQDRRPLSARREPARSAPRTIRRRSRRISTSRTRTAASPRRRCAVSGVGECRRHDGGTMCPSYMVTREEMHSTRGRARLLFEMLEGDPLKDGWQDEHVKEALDLCLACKGCKGECPVNVDMATYKAEFLSHYYTAHRRPITAYAFGLIHWWARLASVAPRLVNAITQMPGLRTLAKLAVGMPLAREIPAFAPQTFQDWFRRRARTDAATVHRCILWPDTFNNHFHPETAIAAVEVLERAGFQVDVPLQSAVLRSSALRLRHAHDRQGVVARRAPTRSVRRSGRVSRSSAWSRAASPSFATRCVTCCPTTKTQSGWRVRPSRSREFLEQKADGFQLPDAAPPRHRPRPLSSRRRS